MSAHNFNDMRVTDFVGKHLQNKRYIFQRTFALWWLWERGPQAFVCAKSNFNLALLIDVAFYFKCLWKYPTTVLCGPVSNETHSRTPPLAIRSVANSQRSPCGVVSEEAEHMVDAAQNNWVFTPHQGNICDRGCEGGFQSPGSGPSRPAVLVLSASSSSGPSPLGPHELPWRASGGLAHQRRGWRVQEQVFRGQPGVLHLISSQGQINVLWCIILIEPAYAAISLGFVHLSRAIYSHPGSQSGYCSSEITWVWCFPGVFLVDGQALAVVLFWPGKWQLSGQGEEKRGLGQLWVDLMNNNSIWTDRLQCPPRGTPQVLHRWKNLHSPNKEAS